MKRLLALVAAATLSACSSNSSINTITNGGAGDVDEGPAKGLDSMSNHRASHVVYFTNDSVEISEDAQSTIVAHAAYLIGKPKLNVSLQGAATATGDSDYNYDLGLKRAETVKKQLVNLGVDSGKIKVTSIGDIGRAITSSEKGDSKRRVTITY